MDIPEIEPQDSSAYDSKLDENEKTNDSQLHTDLSYDWIVHECHNEDFRTLTHACLSPDLSILAIAYRSGKVETRSVDRIQSRIREFDVGDTVLQVSFNPCMKWLACVSPIGVMIYDLEDGHRVSCYQPPQGECRSVAWSTDGLNMYIGMANGEMLFCFVSNIY